MTFEDVLEQIKALPTEQKLKLEAALKESLKTYRKEEAKKKKAEVAKLKVELKKQFIELGDKICDMLQVESFPFTGSTKACDCPYEPDVKEPLDCLVCFIEWLDEYRYENNHNDDDYGVNFDDDEVHELFNKFVKLVEKFDEKIFFSIEDAYGEGAGWTTYGRYVRSDVATDERYFLYDIRCFERENNSFTACLKDDE